MYYSIAWGRGTPVAVCAILCGLTRLKVTAASEI
jgi:hypothetical protein